MNLSPAIKLIKEFEGCSLVAYQDGAGRWTIGYGRARNVKPGDSCSSELAEEWLFEDIDAVLDQVSSLINEILTDNQYCALVSFVYNIGIGRFKSSTLLRNINLGKLEEASENFLDWDHVAGKPCEGLMRRREAERELFLSDN
jgi:lysozyme